MRTKSNTASKRWIWLALLLLVASSVPYSKTKAPLASARGALATASTQLKVAQAKHREWEGKLLVDANAPKDPRVLLPVAEQFNQISYGLLSVAPAHKVVIRSSKVGGASGSAVDLETLATQVPDSQGLFFTTMRLEGDFVDYDEFKSFLVWLQTFPISVGTLNIQQTKFAITIDVYGK
jgi:hypothetical protein